MLRKETVGSLRARPVKRPPKSISETSSQRPEKVNQKWRPERAGHQQSRPRSGGRQA